MLFPVRSNLFEDFFQDDFFTQKANQMMSTNIHEEQQGYAIDISIPGFSKEDLQLDYRNGYLTVHAKHTDQEEKKDDDGKVIQQFTYQGDMSRSFYIGTDLQKEDIKAQFKDGLLTVHLPKNNQQIESKNYITIE